MLQMQPNIHEPVRLKYIFRAKMLQSAFSIWHAALTAFLLVYTHLCLKVCCAAAL